LAEGRTDRRRPKFSPLVTGAGLFCAMLGALVLIGWHVRSTALTRVFPTFRPMVYNVALAFLACGAALALLALGRRRLPALLGLFAAALGAMKLAEYLLGRELGVETLFFRSPALLDPERFGRMAPLTAVSFVLMGAALWISTRDRPSQSRPLLLGLIGAALFGVGAIAALGYAAGLASYLWTPLAGMALHTAVGCLTLGLAVYRLSWTAEAEGPTAPAWTPVLVTVAALVATGFFWRALADQEDRLVSAAVGREASGLAENFDQELGDWTAAIDRTADHWAIRRPDRTEWESDAREILADHPGLRTITWIGPALDPRWFVPEATPGAFGALQRGVLMAAVEDARSAGAAVVTDAVQLPEGSPGLLIVAPLQSGGRFDGALVWSVRLDLFLDSIWRHQVAAGVPVSLDCRSREVYRRRPARLRAEDRLSVQAPGRRALGGWTVRVWPSSSLLAARSRLPGAALVAGILLSLLLGAAVYFWLAASRDAREAESARASLAERTRLATFAAHVGAALTRSESLPAALRACAEAMVVDLGGSIASIWSLNERDGMLELQASAGAEPDPSGSSRRIPIGQFRIGRIAQDGRPQLLDLETGFEQGDKEWALRLGMASFAGYPLAVQGRIVGVMAIFATVKLSGATVHAMASVADEIALGIDRARAAEAVRGSEARTRALIDNMLEGLVVIDRASIIRQVNPAAQRIFGYSRDELLGQPLALLVAEREGRDAVTSLQEKHQEALGRVTEWQARRKNGEVFPVEVALFEFWTSEGRLFGSSFRDISERREVERLKREFVSTVSHELRTPLTSIRGSLGLIAGGVAGPIPEQARSLIEIAHKNSERLVRLVNDILDLEKIESGRIEFHMEPVEVGPLAAAAAEANRAYAAEYGTTFLVEDSAAGAHVLADRDRLTQVVTNLLSNAAKFSPSGVPVTLRVSRRDHAVRISVSDRGSGMPVEFQTRIFQKFQQADSSDTRRKGGTGLGLSISKSIVDRLGGQIGFETAEGAGTTFFVDLPEWHEAEAEETAVPRLRAGQGRPRVLHVDDDDDLRKVIEKTLQDVAQVVPARSLGEARKRLSEGRYDLVLLDIELPDGSGLELLSPGGELAGGSPPVVVFSAQDLPSELSRRVAGTLVKARGSFADLAETVRSFVRAGARQGNV
jgi:PAS domain S-box-containing protein